MIRLRSTDKLYHSITEVSELLKLKPHVLRYWEKEFGMLRPNRNRAGNRMYNKKDIELVAMIKHLLHEQGLTIEGARKRLGAGRKPDGPAEKTAVREVDRRALLLSIRGELEGVLEFLD
ncbi:MAG: MerR family transcriptional regulator [Candidatus Eisenbacteria sp.]|nr:MerR family transcriptional regulator [Candidatus Eisenbacteria bacterium]